MNIKPGDEITIKKGAIVHTTHPSRKQYTLTRRQRVKVHHTLLPHCEEVHWVGTGSYWCWTNLENVEGQGGKSDE